MPSVMQTRSKRVGNVSGGSIDQEAIARVAYELFLKRGSGHGSDQQDWFEAEQIVRQRQRSRRA
ncbi:MAG: DUF2934 domain-containing protein [Candidatus Omnitrophica bacterium]|nr:DUF2934 domain-containing protein [Candidatus Omnitrophota bacterium]